MVMMMIRREFRCSVSTPRHTFYVLAINLTPDLVIGSVIGEEDEGVEEVICAMLGWKDSHGPEGED